MAARPPLRAATLLGAVSFALLAVLAYTPVIGAVGRRIDTAPVRERADAIVVLGAGVSRDGVLTDSSLRRLMGGLVLYRRGLAPRLVLMGPAHQGSPIEAEVRAALALDLGIPPSAIVVEGGGLTTLQEAALAARRVHDLGGQRVLLVTSIPHMRRARRFFERAGLEVVAAPAVEISPNPQSPGGRLDLAAAMIQEALARLYYRVSGQL